MKKEDIKNSRELSGLLEAQGNSQAICPTNTNLLLSYEPSEDVIDELEDFGNSLGRSLHCSKYGSSRPPT